MILLNRRLVCALLAFGLSSVGLAGCLESGGVGKGGLMVVAPEDSQVEVDGRMAGKSNEGIADLDSGSRTVRVIADDGYVLYEGRVAITANQTVTLDTEPVGQALEDGDQNLLADDLPVDATVDDDPMYAMSTKALGLDVSSDFAKRDSMPQTLVPRYRWSSYGSWGPPAHDFPTPKLPGSGSSEWKRQRVVAVAKKYLGLRYKHVHIPAMGGLDCSNFTAWVYNYGLGVQFTSAVADQGRTVGRTVPKSSLLPGDLVFFRNGGKVVHVGMFLGNGLMIDESTMNGGGGKVAIKRLNTGWVASHYAYAKRII